MHLVFLSAFTHVTSMLSENVSSSTCKAIHHKARIPTGYGQLTLVRARVYATKGSAAECNSSELTMVWRNKDTMPRGLQEVPPTPHSIILVRSVPLELVATHLS
jgi:hypothetical protein